jgi:hypothetical protein
VVERGTFNLEDLYALGRLSIPSKTRSFLSGLDLPVTKALFYLKLTSDIF